MSYGLDTDVDFRIQEYLCMEVIRDRVTPRYFQ